MYDTRSSIATHAAVESLAGIDMKKKNVAWSQRASVLRQQYVPVCIVLLCTCYYMPGMYVTPIFWTNVAGNGRKTHIWFCYRCYRKAKTMDEFPPKGIQVRFPPRGYTCTAPPPSCSRCYRGGCFFHHGG